MRKNLNGIVHVDRDNFFVIAVVHVVTLWSCKNLTAWVVFTQLFSGFVLLIYMERFAW